MPSFSMRLKQKNFTMLTAPQIEKNGIWMQVDKPVSLCPVYMVTWMRVDKPASVQVKSSWSAGVSGPEPAILDWYGHCVRLKCE